jgi:hypothetical protein
VITGLLFDPCATIVDTVEFEKEYNAGIETPAFITCEPPLQIIPSGIIGK